MKRLIIVGAMALALAAVAGVQAERADGAFWPANCRGKATVGAAVLCVDRHLNNLNRRLRAQQADINFILSCTRIVRGVTRFGDYASYPDATVANSALDWDTSNPQVWLSTVRPRCVDTSASAQANQFQLYRVQ